MNKELTIKQDDQDFEQALNELTNFNQGGGDYLPIIKFSATDGEWLINRGEKDEEGRFEFSSIGKKLEIHPINCSFKLVQSGDKSPIPVYSKEYTGTSVELIDADTNEVVEVGDYKELKPKYNLRYTQVLYAFYKDEMVRVKLSGFGLTNWFPFVSNGNPVKNLIEFKLGKRMKGDGKSAPVQASKEDITKYDEALKAGKKPTTNLFWEIVPTVVKSMVENPEDKKLVVERVNAVNAFLVGKHTQADVVLTNVPADAKPAEIEITGDVAMPF